MLEAHSLPRHRGPLAITHPDDMRGHQAGVPLVLGALLEAFGTSRASLRPGLGLHQVKIVFVEVQAGPRV